MSGLWLDVDGQLVHLMLTDDRERTPEELEKLREGMRKLRDAPQDPTSHAFKAREKITTYCQVCGRHERHHHP